MWLVEGVGTYCVAPGVANGINVECNFSRHFPACLTGLARMSLTRRIVLTCQDACHCLPLHV